MVESKWTCEWCGLTKKLSPFKAIFKWFLPRYCRVTGQAAGWPHPSCRITANLASIIAEKLAQRAREEFLESVHGQHLGQVRSHALSPF